MFSIRTRIVLAATLVFALILIALSVVILGRFESSSIAAFDAQLAAYASELETEVEEQAGEGIFPRMEEFTAITAKRIPGTRFRIVDSLGTALLADSLVARLPVEPWRALAGPEPSFATTTLGGRDYRSLWAPIEVRDRRQYALQLIAPLDGVDASVRRLRLLFTLALPAALLLLAAATFFIIRRAFRPVATMIATAERISATDLSGRVPVRPHRDEIHALAVALNAMIERLQVSFAAQKRFVADVSHEYGTPLAILRSELEFASSRISDAEALHSLDLGLGEIDRLKRMTGDLLLLARLESSEDLLIREHVRLDEVIAEGCARMNTIAAGKRIALMPQIDEVIEVVADGERLLRAVTNLIDNALKYAPAGTSVRLRLSREQEYAVISVADEGPGIDPAELAAIFNRFRRGDPSRTSQPGFGLGLAIVRRIMELHGGNVAVRNDPGKGCEFRLELPIES